MTDFVDVTEMTDLEIKRMGQMDDNTEIPAYQTIWTEGNRVRAALMVTYVGESDKAVQYQVADNPKMKLWFPKKALKVLGSIGDHSQMKLAPWFTMNEFTKNAFDRYANHYKK